jgi:hypothetical protein
MINPSSFVDSEGNRWSLIRRNWTILSQIAASVMAVVATIVAPPPTPIGSVGLRGFASFIVAVLAGFFLLLLRLLKKKEHRLFWAGITGTLLILTVADYFWYFNLMDSRTVQWHGRTIVCGTEVRSEIRATYGTKLGKSLLQHLLEDAAGDQRLIWTDDSIRSSKDILVTSYLIIVPLISGCIMSATQIASCKSLSAANLSD